MATAIPERIYAQASPLSKGGVSMFGAREPIHVGTVDDFYSDPDVIRRAEEQLRNAGFEVLQTTKLTINIAGSAETYQRAFNTEIVAKELPATKQWGQRTVATFLDSPKTPQLGLIATEGTPFAGIIEGVALEVPRYPMVTAVQPSPFAPDKLYWHLRVPGDIASATNAEKVHRSGITGRGVRVAMVDSGWYRHPYFVTEGYNVAPVVLGPGATRPFDDESGHGTGESANLLAIAPDIDFQPVKANFVNTVGAFNAAVALNPNIITCSWGGDIEYASDLGVADIVLAASIAAAVAGGITVIFSAGNGHFGFPGQHPDVISAGGVFMRPDGSLIASNYASGFISRIYPGRQVPDLCGLVGELPKGIYIMLPVQPNDDLDNQLAGNVYPNGDETAPDDGWAAFSGTSAAAPQLAGVAALIKQVGPRLDPASIKDIMKGTARDVAQGNGNPRFGDGVTGLPALPGPDIPTGNGLVDAYKASIIAGIRNIASMHELMHTGAMQNISGTQALPSIQPATLVGITDGRSVRELVASTATNMQFLKRLEDIVLSSV